MGATEVKYYHYFTGIYRQFCRGEGVNILGFKFMKVKLRDAFFFNILGLKFIKVKLRDAFF